MYVELTDETGQVTERLQAQTLELLELAAERLDKTDKEMAVTFVDDAQIQAINLEYRGLDKPTDVVSLEYKPETAIHVDAADLAADADLAAVLADFDSYIGELFISVDRARAQAADYGHSFEREMGFLAVHGFLHINGYDHQIPEEEVAMFGLQEEILRTYGLKR